MKYEPPVLITGSTEARVSFDQSLNGILGTTSNAIIVDVALLSSIHRSNCALRIAIIISCVEDLKHVIQLLQLCASSPIIGVKIESSNQDQSFDTESQEGVEKDTGKELEDATSDLDLADDTDKRPELHNRILIAGCVPALKDRCAVRLLALHMGGVGVLLSQANDANRSEPWGDSKKSPTANAIFHNILASWSSGDDERTLDAWGDAHWSQETDVIIPPGWDSISKVRAVADAFGVPFSPIVEKGMLQSSADESTAASNTSEPKVLPDQEHENSFQTWRKKHTQWISLMNEKLQKGISPKDDRAAAHSSSNRNDDRRGDGDFFQRLLTSHQ